MTTTQKAEQERLIEDLIRENPEATIQDYFAKGVKAVEKLKTKDIIKLMSFDPVEDTSERQQQRRDCLKRSLHDRIEENEREINRQLITTRKSRWAK